MAWWFDAVRKNFLSHKKHILSFWGEWPNHEIFDAKFAVLLKPFVVLLFASFSSFARRKRRRGWAAAQIGIKSVFVHSRFGAIGCILVEMVIK